jgi:hypothetical protein
VLDEFEVPENVSGNFKAKCKHCESSTKATSNFVTHLKVSVLITLLYIT